MHRTLGPIYFYCLLVLVLCTGMVFAQGAAFDLVGPQIDVKVTRSGKTLPISQVPNLQTGDRLWLHPALPDSQSVRYLLVVVFLRGATDAPPDNWLIKAETWLKPVRQEGLFVTVPPEAQQALLLLAPDSGGGFGAIRNTVRSKPGAFVRASQDLTQASMDRMRLDKYLTEVRATSTYEPKALHDRSVLLARSLTIRLNQECFERPIEEQSSCLTRNTDQLVLDDAHNQSMVATLTSGPNSDLIGQISNTRLAGGGSYSAYVGAVVDAVRIMGNLHSAEYRYIPALALPREDTLELRLNNPPSFRKPKSVMVVGLPPVQPRSFPPLRPVEAGNLYCLQRPSLVLPVEGSPAIFALNYGHDLKVRLQDGPGSAEDVPVVADASRGGLVMDLRDLSAEKLEPGVTATLHGQWGFDAWQGPTFRLRNARPARWSPVSDDPKALVVGRNNNLRLQGDASVCVEDVTAAYPDGREFKADWKAIGRDELEVEVPLTDALPGPFTLLVKQFKSTNPDQVPLQAYAEAANVDRLTLHAGDQQGTLEGNRLDQVKFLEVRGARFLPDGLSRAGSKDQLRMTTADASSSSLLHSNDQVIAHVALLDGRVLDLPARIAAPRPSVALLTKSVQPRQGEGPQFRLASVDDLPQNGRLVFFLKAQVPETFSRAEKIEVAAADGSFRTVLSMAEGDLVLQDPRTLRALLDPLKNFGLSAFGPLRFRPVDANGMEGDWQPLVNLVRLPSLKEVRCPDNPERPCTLDGTDLFLIESASAKPEFTDAVTVTLPFAGPTLPVPRPKDGVLYVKLRDDPTNVNSVSVPLVVRPD